MSVSLIYFILVVFLLKYLQTEPSALKDGSDNQLGGKSRGEPGVRDWGGGEGSQDTAGSLH